ncbi:MAG: hypothetical protein HYW23_03835 [Candidatus Aenigmarchaeota archaeon]|nr:hypothetical protein [Candidatus Aenigmarchaeota archaeon]
MANIFQIVVERLLGIGFYNFLLPFILLSTVLYAVLRKTQLLGDSVALHAIISIAVGLFVFGSPVILGTSLTVPLTSFLTQGVIIILALVFGFLISGLFYPTLGEKLTDIFKEGPASWLVWVVLGFAAAVGLAEFLINPIRSLLSTSKAPGDLLVVTIMFVVFFIVLLIVTMSAAKEIK